MTDANAAAIAIYDDHEGADKAVKTLQQSGFDMKKLSIVGKDYHTEEQVVGYYNAGDRMPAAGEAASLFLAFQSLDLIPQS